MGLRNVVFAKVKKEKNVLALTKVWVMCNSKTRAGRKKLEAFSATADKNYSETAKKL
jgi:hypothetical protein